MEFRGRFGSQFLPIPHTSMQLLLNCPPYNVHAHTHTEMNGWMNGTREFYFGETKHERLWMEEKEDTKKNRDLRMAPPPHLSPPSSRVYGFLSCQTHVIPSTLTLSLHFWQKLVFFWMATGKKSLYKHSSFLNGKGRSTAHQGPTVVPVSHHLCSCIQYRHCLSSSFLGTNEQTRIRDIWGKHAP